MKIKFLLLGTSLSFLPTLVYSQCVATQDCATLGYTETSCNGSKGVKCPFGNKWFCFTTKDELKNELCQELGFTQTCTGENQTGSSYNCNGKYNYCNCTNGYVWKNGKCEKATQNGAIGDLYYCDGVVVGVKTSEMNFYVATNDLGLMNWKDASNACYKYNFCNNIKGILPSKNQLTTIFNNRVQLNNLLSTNRGTKLIAESYWSSTYYGSGHLTVHMVYGPSDDYTHDNNERYVRPVLTSW